MAIKLIVCLLAGMGASLGTGAIWVVLGLAILGFQYLGKYFA